MRLEVGQSSPQIRRPGTTRPIQHTETPPDRHSNGRRGRDQIHVTNPEMVCLTNHVRTPNGWSRHARRTVTKILRNLGLHRRRFIDPNGETNRKPQVIIAKRPGQMVHVDIKKVGKIPDGGGWRAHGRGSEQTKRSQRRKTKNKQARLGYTYLHSAIDGNTRLAYTEARSNETAATAIDFMNNARLFFAAHGISASSA